jgi:2-C-methyl-D-erythritol 4-phosphate cytidylyltransferase / 2-C-methyl-D-erythritol 2,4-cyclodiphosphate synthase
VVRPRIRVAGVVAAGGTGSRMKAGVPKQFMELAGRPILLRTIERIASYDEITGIVIALPAEHVSAGQEMVRSAGLPLPVLCIAGGPTRQESVRLAVEQTGNDADVLLVHDAVRPFCDVETMRRVVDAAWQKGGAVPGLPATETIQRASRSGRVLRTPPREELYAIQTPQCFRAEVLRSALEKAREAGFQGTDESSIVRWAGHPVFVVPGLPENIKITRPVDLLLGESLVARAGGQGNTKMRIGQGTDYHRLIDGHRLVLGGVEIPFDLGLEGHSDADALTHAVCDALLGAAALGDIGRHFPDNDPANRNRPSLEFLREVKNKVESAGWSPVNVDATILAQRPKLAPYMEQMRRNIADCLGLAPDAVNIKATTTEGMNAEGRGEGMSAQAVALLQPKS